MKWALWVALGIVILDGVSVVWLWARTVAREWRRG